ncbi:MAG: hypothetical protein ACK2U1_11455 [Anaerolineales bacterium]|jgi:hypothetical protein
MKKLRRILILIFGIILLASFLVWLIPWLGNGGWPASGPMGNSLPQNIQHVSPKDGDFVEEISGFCVHFDYLAGSGMGEESQKTTRYFFDGRHVTKHVYDSVDLEYPTQIRELCYGQSDLIGPGWHTAKVTYEDDAGNQFEHTWRFQVVDEK